GTSLLKKTDERPKRTVDDPTFEKEFRDYLRVNLHIPLDLVDLFHRQSIRAVNASLGHVTQKERDKIKQKAIEHHPHCYMCNCRLDFTEKDPIRKFTVEHLWPRCYGGDSIDDNLLPACGSCNSDKKGDFATWGMTNVQSLVLGFSPTESELKSIAGTLRF